MEILGVTEKNILYSAHLITHSGISEKQQGLIHHLKCSLYFISFPVGGSAVGGGVVPVSDYSYSSPYSQYTTTYGTYGYGAGGLLSK